jgi:hypothetical protein
VLIGRFNLALKIQFRESSIFSFPVSSICRYPSLGIRYASYFHLIQLADSRSVVIAIPHISTKVIAIQLLILTSILTVKLRTVCSLVKSGVVRCHLICRFLPQTSDSSGFAVFGVAVAHGKCRSMYSSVCPHVSLSRNPRRAYHCAVGAQQEDRVESVGATFSTDAPRHPPESVITHPTSFPLQGVRSSHICIYTISSQQVHILPQLRRSPNLLMILSKLSNLCLQTAASMEPQYYSLILSLL